MARTAVGSETSRWTSGFDPKTTGNEATFDAMAVAGGPPVDRGRRGPVPVLDLPGAWGAAGSYPIHGRNPRARPDRDASATAIFLRNLGRVARRSGGRRLVFLAVSPTRIRARARRDPLHHRGRGRFPSSLANPRVRPSTRVAPPALRASDRGLFLTLLAAASCAKMRGRPLHRTARRRVPASMRPRARKVASRRRG